jgi:hypothetical protein
MHTVARVVVAFLFTLHTVSATTYISVEPIPNRDVVGDATLALIRSIGYSRLERWSERFLTECLAVDNVIFALSAHGAITSVTPTNTRFVVAAGGFEGATNPSYVATVDDSGPDAASARDVDVLDNALGYVLNQGGTVHFSADNAKAYAFALDYAVVTFPGMLSGDEARLLFETLGIIDPALYSGQFAGFTQVQFGSSSTNNSMLFLQPAVTKQQFISGIDALAKTEPGAVYFPLKPGGTPTTARAGIAFPGNDWLAFPNGDQYLANIGGTSALLDELGALRQKHLIAVQNLVTAINNNRVDQYLKSGFRCPS